MNKRMIQRVLLGLMVLLWMGLIYSFSAEKAESSAQLSNGITKTVQQIFYSDWSELPEEDYNALLSNLSFLIRKIAHFLEYVCLGILLAGFFDTFFKKQLPRFLCAFFAGSFYAVTDELHQLFVEGRSMGVFDMLIDSAGVFFGSLCLLGLLAMVRLSRREWQ